MKSLQRISITLAICLCLGLPAAAQKNGRALQRALTQGSQRVGATLPLTVQTLKITNLPARPSVNVWVDVPPAPHITPGVRLVAPRQVRSLLYKSGEHKMFVPQDFVNQTPSLYRGMAIENLDELKNILVNGLETRKTNFKNKIFTAYDPLTAVLYSQPTHRYSVNANLPVLIKIPITSFLEQYPSEKFATAQAFRQNILAGAISDVWVLLEVNQKADWYKVTLENGEIVLFPAHGQLQDAP